MKTAYLAVHAFIWAIAIVAFVKDRPLNYGSVAFSAGMLAWSLAMFVW